MYGDAVQQKADEVTLWEKITTIKITKKKESKKPTFSLQEKPILAITTKKLKELSLEVF